MSDCFFCGKDDACYSKQDKDGVEQDCCWSCISEGLEPVAQQKRAAVKTEPTEDLDADAKLSAAEKEAKKIKGLAPSTVRASTW